MSPSFTDLQLDALRELANIASGSAATALSQMLARDVDINVPRVLALPLADAVDACGSPDEMVAGVVIPVEGNLQAIVLLLIGIDHADSLCRLLGVDAGTEVGESALREIGNIVGTNYLNGLAGMTGLELFPCPPHLSIDMLGAIVASLLAQTVGAEDLALVLDSELTVSGDPCAISFVLLPTVGGISELLTPLGLGGGAT